MLGRLKRLFSEEQQESGVEGAQKIVEQAMAGEAAAARGRLQEEISKVMGEYAALRRLYAGLSETDATVDYQNTVKEKLCRRATELLDVDEPEAGYTPVVDFLRLSEERLKSIGKLSYKEVLHLYAFKDEMNRIASQTKSLIGSLNSLAAEAEKSILKDVERFGGSVEKVAHNRSLKQELVSHIVLLEKEAAAKQGELEEKVSSLSEFSSLEEQINDLKKSIGETNAEAGSIERRISEEFAGTEKLFRKHRHAAGLKGLLDDYIKDPVGALLNIDKDSGIVDILDSMIENKDSIGPKGFGKISQLRRNIQLLLSLRDQLQELKGKKTEHEDSLLKLSSRSSDKEYRVREIRETQEEIKRLEREREEKLLGMKALDSETRNELKKAAEISSELTGKKIMISE